MYGENYDDDDEDNLEIDLLNTADFPCSLSPVSAESENKGSKMRSISEDSGTTQFQGLSFAQMLNRKTDDTTPSIERVSVNTVDTSFPGVFIFIPLTYITFDIGKNKLLEIGLPCTNTSSRVRMHKHNTRCCSNEELVL